MVGAVAFAAENRKVHTNSRKCQELGWACTPLAVEAYDNRVRNISSPGLPSQLAISQSRPKALVMADIYGRLNLHLIRSIARALLARELDPS